MGLRRSVQDYKADLPHTSPNSVDRSIVRAQFESGPSRPDSRLPDRELLSIYVRSGVFHAVVIASLVHTHYLQALGSQTLTIKTSICVGLPVC